MLEVLPLLVLLVALPRVGVVVYPRVAGQLVGARELLAAAGELAGVRLLTRVGADVTSLVLEAVEGLVAQGALVGSRELALSLGGLSSWERPIGSDDGDGSHIYFLLLLLLLLSCTFLVPSN